MTIAEILEQAKKLTPEEQDELLEQLRAIREASQSSEPVAPEEHWGKNLLRLLDEIGPIELVHPEIEDPVEWVKQIRREERQQRLGDWGEEE